MVNIKQCYWIFLGIFLVVVVRHVYAKGVRKTTLQTPSGNTNSRELIDSLEFKRTLGRYKEGSAVEGGTQSQEGKVILEGYKEDKTATERRNVEASSGYEGLPSDKEAEVMTQMSDDERERDVEETIAQIVIKGDKRSRKTSKEVEERALQNEDIFIKNTEQDEREENKTEFEENREIVSENIKVNDDAIEEATEDVKATVEDSTTVEEDHKMEKNDDSTAEMETDDTTVNENSTEATDTVTGDIPVFSDKSTTKSSDHMDREEIKLNEDFNSNSNEQTTTQRNTLTIAPHYAKLGQFPWIVVFKASALNYYRNGDHLCTGSLIDTMWVLTVAHCFQPDDDPSLYTVFAGIIQVPAANVKQHDIAMFHQERKVSQIIPHPRFLYGELKEFLAVDSLNGIVDLEKNMYQYNVALMRLQTPFRDDSHVIIRPLDLTSSVGFLDEALCTIVSWERFQDESQFVHTQVEMRLQWKNVSVEPPKVCENQYKMDIPNIVCLGSNEVNKTCYGPGGSPLVCTSSVKKRVTELIGISLWFKTRVGCTYKKPQYLWIKGHSHWLQKVMHDPDLLMPSYRGRQEERKAVRFVDSRATTSQMIVDRVLILALLVCVLRCI